MEKSTTDELILNLSINKKYKSLKIETLFVVVWKFKTNFIKIFKTLSKTKMKKIILILSVCILTTNHLFSQDFNLKW